MTPLTLTDLSSSASKTIRCDVAAERVSKIDLAALLDGDDADGRTDERILAFFTRTTLNHSPC